jgi:hypothetical protein
LAFGLSFLTRNTQSVFMKKALPGFILFSIISFSAQAQIISQFNWNSNPVTQAVVGPNATSVSPNATSSAGGVGGTNGLNAGSGRTNIDMVLPGAVFTSQSGLDISVDFAREENAASFFTIGGLDFGISGGSIYVKFLLRESGSDVSINLTNKFTTPIDVAFHTYRFIYDNISGKVILYLDGVQQYTAQAGPAGTSLSWTGAGTATIASGMDGSNNNVPVLDNLLIQVPNTILPLDLLSFEARTEGAGNDLLWTTAHEVNTREFIIERSADGVKYESIGTLPAQQNYSGNANYRFTDNSPSSVNFYRLKMVDIDGDFSYSPIRELSSSPAAGAAVSISCYPNPVVNYVNIRIDHSTAVPYYYSVVTLDGKIMQSGMIQAGGVEQQASLNLSAAPKGIFLIRVQEMGNATAQTFKILKQ